MIRKLCAHLLYKTMGWRKEIIIPMPEKCIICLAPHTSNWDFIIGQLYTQAEGLKTNFLMKKEWFFWPLGPIFRHLGGIPVFRAKHTHMTDAMAEAARNHPHFCLAITPEGTRSRVEEWKKGFWYIAKGANIPILLYGVDYEKKLIRCTKEIIPGDDIDAQMREIKLYFKDFKGKKPENFSIGEI